MYKYYRDYCRCTVAATVTPGCYTQSHHSPVNSSPIAPPSSCFTNLAARPAFSLRQRLVGLLCQIGFVPLFFLLLRVGLRPCAQSSSSSSYLLWFLLKCFTNQFFVLNCNWNGEGKPETCSNHHSRYQPFVGNLFVLKIGNIDFVL
jgi:hypothetical protein